MAFDGIVAKAITSELKNLINYKIDKVFEPNKNTITLGLYGKSENFLLNICIDAKYYRIHLTTNPKPNPVKAANFCMFLRKHILGYTINNIYTSDLERIVFIKLSSFDNIEQKTLIIELMGKHSNIILLDKNNIIIDSMRHTYSNENSHRDIFPGKKYIFPNTNKINFLNVTSFENFNKLISIDNENIATSLANTFTGFSYSFVQNILNDLKINNYSIENIKLLYDYLKNLIANLNSSKLTFLPIYNTKIFDHNKTKYNFELMNDYYISITDSIKEPFFLNFFLDDFYLQKETENEFKNTKLSLYNLVLNQHKKYSKRLENITEKLNECSEMDKYKLYGELITANLYKIKSDHCEFIEIENYYDNYNIIHIPLDIKYSPAFNAKRYFKKYTKLKNASNIVDIQKTETLNEINYIESILYEVEDASNVSELQIINEEISENILFKTKLQKINKMTNNKQIAKKKSLFKFSPITLILNNHTILIGRNNKENDYLSLKYANNCDLWFHTKNIHGSHVILKCLPNENITENLIINCAKLAALHSKGKNSSNVPVDYCYVKYVKKPSNSKPGMVIYTNNKTVNVNPEGQDQ